MNPPGNQIDNLQEERLESALGAIRRLFDAGGRHSAARADDLLANLHVAARHLHRSLDVHEVLVNMREVLINLVGADRFRLYLLDPTACELVPLADETMARPQAEAEPLDERCLGTVTRSGVPFFGEGDDEPPAVVPVRAEGNVIGVIRIDNLLPQKKELHAGDREVLDLVSDHAGVALVSAAAWRSRRQDADGADGYWHVLAGLLESATDGSAA